MFFFFFPQPSGFLFFLFTLTLTGLVVSLTIFFCPPTFWGLLGSDFAPCLVPYANIWRVFWECGALPLSFFFAPFGARRWYRGYIPRICMPFHFGHFPCQPVDTFANLLSAARWDRSGPPFFFVTFVTKVPFWPLESSPSSHPLVFMNVHAEVTFVPVRSGDPPSPPAGYWEGHPFASPCWFGLVSNWGDPSADRSPATGLSPKKTDSVGPHTRECAASKIMGPGSAWFSPFSFQELFFSFCSLS